MCAHKIMLRSKVYSFVDVCWCQPIQDEGSKVVEFRQMLAGPVSIVMVLPALFQVIESRNHAVPWVSNKCEFEVRAKVLFGENGLIRANVYMSWAVDSKERSRNGNPGRLGYVDENRVKSIERLERVSMIGSLPHVLKSCESLRVTPSEYLAAHRIRYKPVVAVSNQ